MNYTTLPLVFIVSLVSILLLRPLARKLGLVDTPGGRKTHSKETPLIGGLGIFVGLMAGSLLSPEVMMQYQPLLLISCILLVIGLVDDFYPLPAVVRMGFQITAAWLMCDYGNNQLITLGNLFTENELFLGRYSTIMTIFATVGVINAINMIDGMDGLSGGLALICLGGIAIAAGFNGNNPALYSFTLITIAGLVAFLLLNFRAPAGKPALIYLGDSGSTMLGFILAWLLIESSQGGVDKVIHATVALWFMAIPLMDTVYLFIARPLAGKSPFEPGTDHLHHLLAMHGMSKARVVLLLYAAGICFGLVGLAINSMSAVEYLAVYLFMGVFGLYVVLMRWEGKST
ncbi:MAG: undecaprenyl/decaprenyl-phosphate alpha-N-acetylglucosaminyl 1-phosphate transferase [Gammaproteobacteria bacterium]|nr:undecaprenyl/decaprenyl-phosphate alpha-N-acetylglucosaminyl 1-phosphate transferase [Gammaproteobacteria bacterium]